MFLAGRGRLDVGLNTENRDEVRDQFTHAQKFERQVMLKIRASFCDALVPVVLSFDRRLFIVTHVSP